MAWILYSEGSFVVIKVNTFADFCVARMSVNLRIAQLAPIPKCRSGLI